MASVNDNPLPIGSDPASAGLPDTAVAASSPLCPVDRLPRRRRNQICITIIAIGLLNFLAYTLSYGILGGDAYNGYRKTVLRDGSSHAEYFIRGHHVRVVEGLITEVSRGTWIYSYLHSITVPLTSGALIISMLILARPHIIATMRDGWIGGPTFVIAFGTIVILASLAATIMLISHFVAQLAGR